MKEEKDMLQKKETNPSCDAQGAAPVAKFDVEVPHLWLPVAFRVEKESIGSRLVSLVTRKKKQQAMDSTTVPLE